MAGIPQNFQAISNVLANYNFVDIASGTGYINFYLGNSVDKRIVSNFTFFSEVVSESGGDHDYDILLNRPLDLKGLGVINIPLVVYCAGYGANTITPTVYIRKWDGVTETEIVSNVGTTLSVSVGGVTTYKMDCIDLDIPLTHFKIGETLRITVNCSITGNQAHGEYMNYAHDPKNRSAGWDSTGAVPSQLMFQCPVRLNL